MGFTDFLTQTSEYKDAVVGIIIFFNWWVEFHLIVCSQQLNNVNMKQLEVIVKLFIMKI